MSKVQKPRTSADLPRNRTCGKPCEVYSRVCGYFRPTALWNEGKQAELADRKDYAV